MPNSTAEAMAFAQTTYDRKFFLVAARIWGEALEADSKLQENIRGQIRYTAAGAAARAAAGQMRDDAAKVKLRQ